MLGKGCNNLKYDVSIEQNGNGNRIGQDKNKISRLLGASRLNMKKTRTKKKKMT